MSYAAPELRYHLKNISKVTITDFYKLNTHHAEDEPVSFGIYLYSVPSVFLMQCVKSDGVKCPVKWLKNSSKRVYHHGGVDVAVRGS